MEATSSTPPPSTRMRDPSTPKYGSFYDDYEPFAPRKSARLFQRPDRLAQTPPPQETKHNLRTSHSSPPTTIKKVASTYLDRSGSPPPPTLQRSIRKKSSGAPAVTITRASGSMEVNTTSTNSLSLDDGNMASTQSLSTNGMLPTPSKTPNKREKHIVAGVSAIARNLFPVRPDAIDEVMPTPRRRNRKKFGNFILEEEDDTPIEIFTDSHERIPEPDASADNPFYTTAIATQPPSTRRTSKRRKINVPGEGEKLFDETARREDGLVYTFRGKKIFRKFAVDDEDISEAGMGSDTEIDAALDATVPARLRGPLTRSSIKPRLLFAPSKPQAVVDEEEAITDIDEPSGSETPKCQSKELPATPSAPRFAPASPPTTVRGKKSGKKVERHISPVLKSRTPFGSDGSDDLPTTRSGVRGKASPFDGWKRTKATSSSHGTKREGDTITRSGGDITKRLRGHAS